MAGDPLVDGIIAGRLAALQGRGSYQTGQNLVVGLSFLVYKALAFCLATILCIIAPFPGILAYGTLIVITNSLMGAFDYLTEIEKQSPSLMLTLFIAALPFLSLITIIVFVFKLPSAILYLVRAEARLIRGMISNSKLKLPTIMAYSMLSFGAASLLCLFLFLDFFPPYSPASASSIHTLEQFYELVQAHIRPEFGWTGLFDPALMGSATLTGVALSLAVGLTSFGRTLWLIRNS